MNELDEVMANCYQKTNAELIVLLKSNQQSTFDKMYKSNIILSVVCLMLCLTVIIVSVLGYFTNKKWIDTFNSYEYEYITYEQDGQGVNNVNLGEMGDICNGSESSN